MCRTAEVRTTLRSIIVQFSPYHIFFLHERIVDPGDLMILQSISVGLKMTSNEAKVRLEFVDSLIPRKTTTAELLFEVACCLLVAPSWYS